ncbi:hypothetical protein ACXZ7E_02610 [Paenibacillus lautus]
MDSQGNISERIRAELPGQQGEAMDMLQAALIKLMETQGVGALENLRQALNREIASNNLTQPQHAQVSASGMKPTQFNASERSEIARRVAEIINRRNRI